MTRSISRRGMIRTSLATVSLAASHLALAFEKECRPSPTQGAGPFYPNGTIPAESDLTTVPGSNKAPSGEQIYMLGRVTDEDCHPVAGARVEIWQADTKGQYKRGDRDEGAHLDPNFQYFGSVLTNPHGDFLFRTIKPSKYGAGGFQRSPHIHTRIASESHKVLTTEMYFEGEEASMRRDDVFLSVPEDRRHELIANAQSAKNYADRGFKLDKTLPVYEVKLVVAKKRRAKS